MDEFVEIYQERIAKRLLHLEGVLGLTIDPVHCPNNGEVIGLTCYVNDFEKFNKASKEIEKESRELLSEVMSDFYIDFRDKIKKERKRKGL